MRGLDSRLLNWGRPTRVYMALSVVLGSVRALLVVAQAWLLSTVVGRVFLGHQGLDAVKGLLADRKDISRDNMRDYIQTAKVKTLQGTIWFDTNGDLQDRTISVFQIRKDVNYSADDMVHQYHYIGVASQS